MLVASVLNCVTATKCWIHYIQFPQYEYQMKQALSFDNHIVGINYYGTNRIIYTMTKLTF